ncbi:MAG: RluA family pseudouridine synthase [Ideonella sp.]
MIEQKTCLSTDWLSSLYSDEICIAVDKPPGRLSVPGRGGLAEGSVAQQVQQQWPDALTVHRLDMATSGVLLFARGSTWQRHFSSQFEQRRIVKTYIAIVTGRLGNQVGDSGRIDLPLAADWPNRPRQRVDNNNGKPSQTLWRVVAHDPLDCWTRVELEPLTGRSHQLRVHLLAIGHPIIGDALYGKLGQESPAPRLMLHARSLGFFHPLSGARVVIESPARF